MEIWSGAAGELTFEKIWQDDNLIELKISASSEYVSAYQNCYIQDTDLEEIAEKICNYVNNYKESYRIYGLETDYAQLTEQENSAFKELLNMTARFSEFEEDLKIPHMYFSGEEIIKQAKKVQKLQNK